MGFHSWQWHQKLTVSVDTPDGVVSGSSVTLVELSLSPEWAGVGDFAGAANYSLKGEAVVVEVSPGRYLFALLKDYGHETAVKTFIPPDERARTRQESLEMFNRLEALRQAKRVPSDLYPLLVTFDDINDPASAKKIDPGNLEAVFGPGYRLNSLTLTMSDEPMTEGKMDSVLGWLGPYPEPRLSPATGRTTDIPFSRRISHGDFIRR